MELKLYKHSNVINLYNNSYFISFSTSLNFTSASLKLVLAASAAESKNQINSFYVCILLIANVTSVNKKVVWCLVHCFLIQSKCSNCTIWPRSKLHGLLKLIWVLQHCVCFTLNNGYNVTILRMSPNHSVNAHVCHNLSKTNLSNCISQKTKHCLTYI